MFSHVGFSLACPLCHSYAAAAEKISVTLRDGVSRAAARLAAAHFDCQGAPRLRKVELMYQ